MNKIEKFIFFLKENKYFNNLEVRKDNLTVGGGLYLSETPIKGLPNNLTIGGNLYLNGYRRRCKKI